MLYSTYENFNEFMSINTLNESENSLDFLEKDLSSTKIPEVRNALSQLIKKEYQDITFAKQKTLLFLSSLRLLKSLLRDILPRGV